eukprot:scaffold87285_cov52-Phaeocystis_antarctica.AAC.1
MVRVMISSEVSTTSAVRMDRWVGRPTDTDRPTTSEQPSTLGKTGASGPRLAHHTLHVPHDR